MTLKRVKYMEIVATKPNSDQMAAEKRNKKQQQQQQQSVGLSRYQFFKVLLPDFLNKLYLPPAFCKVISKQKHKNGTIRGPLGKSWHVEVLEDSKGLYFGEGWRDFAMAHDLTVGCFLVFKYEGSMDFSVTVFDVSTCEKVYARKQGKYQVILRDPGGQKWPVRIYHRRQSGMIASMCRNSCEKFHARNNLK